MIPFFRKIRYRLAQDNQPASPAGRPACRTGRFLKYSRYAIGEIVLVVIGILIALYINNWNEDRKERVIEIRYLQNLKSDLKNDSLALLEIRAHRLNTVKAAKELLSIANSGEIENVHVVDSLYWTIGIWWEFIPNDNTFQDLISSGRLNIIQDESIKKSLLKLSKDSEQISVDRDHLRREYDQYLYDEMVSTISFLKRKNPDDFNDQWESWFFSNREAVAQNEEVLKNQYKKLLSNPIFVNGVVLAGGNSVYLVSVYDRVLQDITELIEKIDESIIR